ncbi:hypothetical protein NLX83_37900 [Allokutzneria sp. A3M-2-11 16]|uniref:hypothetical protein n=1 Tax=Allokutzneria sp. A3M-2-11 16 TaxID=2962043 RepID=UPI0020B8B8FB|nr:hypothetical protein [Allokutzneria sp. A3M-2-11 16]MCP3805057.1 hypothetical protein [Allokutzneria sp. A3M-2-11 16]
MNGSVGELLAQLLQLIEQLPAAVVLQNKSDALAAADELAEAWRSTGDASATEVVGFIHQAVDQLEDIVERLAGAGDLVSVYIQRILAFRVANVGEVAQRLRAALHGIRPEELMTTAARLREDLVVLRAAAVESNQPDLQEAFELLANVPDELEAAAVLYIQARSGTEHYIRRHSRAGVLPDAAKPSGTKASPRTGEPARFGWTTSTNYRKTFFDAHPHTEGKVVVHHAVEQQVLQRYPDVVQPEEMHSLENLRGIPRGETNNKVHLSALRRAWNAFYLPFTINNAAPTAQQLLDFATMLDDQYGSSFNPNIREK